MNAPGRQRRPIKPRLLLIVPATALAAAAGLASGGLLTIPGSAHADATSTGSVPFPATAAPLPSPSPSTTPVTGSYPQITDPTGYTFTKRDYQFVGLSPDQVNDMLAQKVPLGMTAAQWSQATSELSQALIDSGIPDADIRLKGSSMRFFSYDTKTKGFPQTVDELKTRAKAYNAASPDAAAIADQAAQTYQSAGYGTSPQPVHSFFNALAKLHCGDPSDYDIQVVSQTLADKFEDYIRKNPTEPVLGDDEQSVELDPAISGKGGHYKWRYLQYVAKPLWDWSQRWTGMLGTDVAVSTFSPARAPTLRDTDWIILKAA
jgi:hypothetical protein